MTSKHHGMSLVELLMGLLISSLIFLTLMQVYLSGKRQYQAIQKQLAMAFEVEKVALWMKDSVARAGFTPCLGIDNLVVKDRRNPSNHPKALVIENQALHINRMSNDFERVLEIQSPFKLLLTHNKRIRINHPLIIADCKHAEIHMPLDVIKTPRGQEITLARPLVFQYDTTAYAGKWVEESWAVHAKSRGLYYHTLKSTEAISSFITSLFAMKEDSLVSIIMALKGQNARKIVVRIRGL